MGIPTLLASVYSGTSLRIIFDEAVSVSGGIELNGFTFVRNGSSETPTFTSVAQNAIQATLTGSVTTLTVAYNSGTGNVVSVSTSQAATSFSATAAVAYPVVAVTERADAGQPANDVVRIYFSQPVASTTDALKLGFTIKINTVPLVLTSATASLDSTLTILSIATGTNFAYSDIVDVLYDHTVGTLYSWPTGIVADFSFTAIPNLSTDGLPNSQYPLSWVTSEVPTIDDRTVISCLGLTLNPIDVKLVAEYGPALLLTGGTFGVTDANPAGVSILGHQVILIDGILFCERFTNLAYPPSWLVAAADDWQTTMTTKIGVILGQYRAIDQTLTLHGQTVTAV